MRTPWYKSGWLFWGILVLIILAFNFLLIRFSPSSREARESSTYHTGPNGLKALYTLLEDSGFDVSRKKTSMKVRPPKDAVLVIIAPAKLYDEEEMLELKEWLSQGGTMVVALKHSTWNPRFGVAVGNIEGHDSSDSKDRRPLVASSFSPISKGVEKLDPEPFYGIVQSGRNTIYHLDSGESTVLVERRIGRGRLFFFSCPEAVTNANLGKADNLRFILNILYAAGEEKPILFDEHHNEYTATEWTGTWGFIRLFFITPYGLFALLCTAGLVFWLLNRDTVAVRHPRPYVEKPSSLDHIRAVAVLQSKLLAYPYAAERLLKSLQKDMAEKFGVNNNTDMEQLFALLAGMNIPVLKENMDSIIQYQQKLKSGLTPSAGETLHMAQCVETIKRELRK